MWPVAITITLVGAAVGYFVGWMRGYSAGFRNGSAFVKRSMSALQEMERAGGRDLGDGPGRACRAGPYVDQKLGSQPANGGRL